MTVIALASTRSSPGVSSLAVALALVWHRQGRQPLLVEGDPAGGVLGLRFDQAAEPSLATLAADLRRGYESERFVKNAVEVMGVRSLLAPADPLTASRVLQRNGPALVEAIEAYGHPAIIDLGRLDPHNPALTLARPANRVLLVSRPRAEDVQSLLYGCRLLRSHQLDIALVLIGDRPYRPAEIAELADVPLAAVIPDSPKLATAFSGGRFSGRRLRRSLLWRSVQALADALAEQTPAELEAGRDPTPAADRRAGADSTPAETRVGVDSAPAALPTTASPPSPLSASPPVIAGARPVVTTSVSRCESLPVGAVTFRPDTAGAWPPPVSPDRSGVEMPAWHVRARGARP